MATSWRPRVAAPYGGRSTHTDIDALADAGVVSTLSTATVRSARHRAFRFWPAVAFEIGAYD